MIQHAQEAGHKIYSAMSTSNIILALSAVLLGCMFSRAAAVIPPFPALCGFIAHDHTS